MQGFAVDADDMGGEVSAHRVLVDRPPPHAISKDRGATRRDAGGRPPRGLAVAIPPDDPHHQLYAGRNRLFLSHDGGTFWRALVVELPEIEAVAFA